MNMKRFLILPAAAALWLHSAAQPDATQSYWSAVDPAGPSDRTVVFADGAAGRRLAVMWGFDTAWNDYANMLRGIRYAGVDAIGCARVSFQPWAEITRKGVLPEMLQKNLDARMKTVGLIGKKVDIVLNLDGGDNTVKEIYGGYRYENPDDPWWSPKEYIGDVTEQGPKWADLIDATAAAVEDKGYRVVTASPLNEPDLELNGTPIELFYQIARNLKDYDRYPRFRDIRISGGNTLNNDEALRWYEYNKVFLDEGNTHQLAGSFDTYADFFRKVREDGKYATADELHNVMEAMVGAEYGMQTGIWWGTAEKARGEFMKASFGERLGYAENRNAWSAASVYRNPEGELKAFVGCSERQARPSSFSFVSADRPFYVNGAGPLREYVVNVPGDPDGAYQSALQRNAEAVFDIETGTDIQPEVCGDCYIVNCSDGMALGIEGGVPADAAGIVQAVASGSADQIWNIGFVPENWGGDFSYRFIRNIDGESVRSLDDNNWNLEDGGKVICYGFSGSGVQQWALEYAGAGTFRIRNKHSALYLTVDDAMAGSAVCQREYADGDRQLWRFIPAGAEIEYDAPSVPSGLEVRANSASALLKWLPSSDAQAVTYCIARACGDESDFDIIARGVDGTSFLDNSLPEAESARYKVMAVDAAGNMSEFCEEAELSLSGKERGLIARYAFDDTACDETENRFDLKTFGSTAYRNGPDGESRAIVLHTSGFCQLPYSALSSDEFSVSLWFRVTSAQKGKCLFSTGLGSGNSLALYPYSDGCAELRAESDGASCVLSADSPATGEWVHVAVVAGADGVAMYVDGQDVGRGDSHAMREAIPESRLLTYLCCGPDRSGAFAGSVADMRVFNRAITPEEVRAVMAEVSSVGTVGVGSMEPVAVEYYTPDGVRLAAPAACGLTITRTVYADGSCRTSKTMR